MKKTLLVTAGLAGAILSGCATQSSNTFQAFQPEDLNALVKSGKLVQKTNSFLVVNDSSSSMSRTFVNSAEYSGTKLDVEKNLLNKFNKSIPNIPLTSGLRSFGFGPCLDWSATKLNQPLQSYTQAGFESSLSSLTCSSGGTPLATALEATNQDLAGGTGNLALIVLSDGIEESSPAPAAAALKAQYGDRLCIYTVWVGNDEDAAGQAELQQIADAGGCGFSTTADAISSPKGMSDFVKNVFLKAGTPPAVADCSKQDDDKDGVNNCADKCPDTPKGAIVDKDGCWAFRGVLFDFDKSDIKSKYHPLIQNAVEVMKLNPGLTVEIQGHTDSYGSDAYNEKLSQRRANAVRNELIKQGVDGKRLTAEGFGESQPVDTNETDEGRAYNRRVVYKRTDR
ncbi:flagellar motor protein MotB [Methylomonas sp. LWB]|uniref:OmpA family protein n=1 Tax=Methylomonas sp. LWB TaxID=1905845 RepID=UPI0008DA4E80|nr:OmpA family protein [Methylomonas sp. LWB]OHX34433.1 flagellar motor protein MotB [Methylomonas sp. LWB]